MANPKDMRPVRAFSKAFGLAVRDRMKADGVTQSALAEASGHDQGYVSERVNGKRPFSTDEIDVLAELISKNGTRLDGRTLLIELARAAQVPNVGGDSDTSVAEEIPTLEDRRLARERARSGKVAANTTEKTPPEQ